MTPEQLMKRALREYFEPEVTMNRDRRQGVVGEWVRLTFGTQSDRVERARRLLEETAELVQACGLDETEAVRIVAHVFKGPPGEVLQEAGGVGMTLLALAASFPFSADAAERAELYRVLALKPEHFRQRHAFKSAAGIAAPVKKETDK